jgi:hypothetical protein
MRLAERTVKLWQRHARPAATFGRLTCEMWGVVGIVCGVEEYVETRPLKHHVEYCTDGMLNRIVHA